MEKLSEMMGNHQFANVLCECVCCKRDIEVQLERISETGLKVTGGQFGKYRDEIQCMCNSCLDAGGLFGTDCEIYSRVVGYMRPVSSWNQAKRAEFNMRKEYKLIE